MKLNVMQRLQFSNFYPAESSIQTQLIVREITRKVVVDDKEAVKIELKQLGNSLQWNEKKATEKNVDFNDLEINFLQEQIKMLDKQQKITQSLLELCLLIQNYKKSS